MYLLFIIFFKFFYSLPYKFFFFSFKIPVLSLINLYILTYILKQRTKEIIFFIDILMGTNVQKKYEQLKYLLRNFENNINNIRI